MTQLGHAFLIFIASNALSLIAIWIQRIGVGWIAWTSSHSGAWLGILAVVDLAPRIVLSPLVGFMLDRLGARKVLIGAQCLFLAQGLLLVALALLGLTSMVGLLVVCLLRGTANALYEPAGVTVVRNLVPLEHLAAAVSLNSIVKNSTVCLGPLLLLVTLDNMEIILAASTLISAVVLTVIFSMAIPPLEKSPRIGFIAAIGDAYRYAYGHRLTRAMLLACFGVSLGARAIIELMPSIADRFSGMSSLALLNATLGGGAMAAGAWMIARGAEGLPRLVTTQAAVAGFGVSMLALATTEWLALMGTFVLGIAVAINGIGCQTVLQTTTDDAMTGRIISLYAMVFVAGQALGALLLGSLTAPFGITVAALCGAAITLGVSLYLVIGVPVESRERLT